jgi:OmpA-OmpF porin, OOP family
MIKRFAFGVIAAIFAIPVYSQQWKLKRVEGIFGIGTTNVYSDLGGAPNATSLLFINDITFRSTRPSLYGGIRYRIKPNYSVKVSLIYGYSKTQDNAGSRNEKRGFSSVTQLVELSGTFEYYFLPELRRLRSAAMFNRRGMINDYSFFGAYAFAGIGATFFWPHLTLEEPRPGDRYKDNMGVTAALPVGIGLKYIISDKWIFGYEIGYRLTISDFLDGFISPSSKRPDTYWISAFNLNYRIPTSRRGLPIFLDRQWRKARF